MRSSCRNSCLLIIQLRNSDGLSMSWAEISWVDRHTQHSVNNEIFDQQALGFSELQQVRNQDEVELIFMFPLPPTFSKHWWKVWEVRERDMHEPPTILCGRIIKNWDFSTKIFFCVQHDDNALQRASVNDQEGQKGQSNKVWNCCVR